MKSASKTTASGRMAEWMVVLFLAMAVPCVAQSSSSQNASTTSHKQRSRRMVLVSIADRRLAVIENEKVLAYFSVSVGAEDSPSPTGAFEIVNRVANPAYYHDGVVMEASENSPVGTRWIGLNLKGYGIHGTNAPRSIGRAASHGCIRLKNRDVERLYTMLRIGDVVSIRGKRDEEVAQVFGGSADGDLSADAAEAVGQ